VPAPIGVRRPLPVQLPISRRPLSEIKPEFELCDWADSCVGASDEDGLWADYERVHGDAAQHTGLRESENLASLGARSACFFTWLARVTDQTNLGE